MHEPGQEADARNDRSGAVAPLAPVSPLGTIPLNEHHDVAAFGCSRSARVEDFLRTSCHTYEKLGYARVFVWPNPDDAKTVWGYYTLSSNIVQKADLSNKYDRKALKGLPVPVALIGYMGRSDTAPKGLGAALIHDAALRVSRNNDIGLWGLALDAENEGLAAWYAKVGFTPAKTKPLFMYGPLKVFLPEMG